jgi:hypothetical protein
MALVAGIAARADSSDDMDRLRHGAMGRMSPVCAHRRGRGHLAVITPV